MPKIAETCFIPIAFNGVDFFFKPAAHLVASVATDDGLDAVFGVNLVHQFLSTTVFKPRKNLNNWQKQCQMDA
jgi:hypothetical protein